MMDSAGEWNESKTARRKAGEREREEGKIRKCKKKRLQGYWSFAANTDTREENKLLIHQPISVNFRSIFDIYRP